MSETFDALLLVSFGGPEGSEEIWPFLKCVANQRNIPPERLKEVADRYELMGGVSPLNERMRKLQQSVSQELKIREIQLDVYWGNRNSPPFIADTVAEMTDKGIKRVLAWPSSPYSSYSSCRQYREDIQNALEVSGKKAPVIEQIRRHHDHPGLIEPAVDRLHRALKQLSTSKDDSAAIVFTAHSIPTSMAMGCRYEEEIREVADLVGSRVDPDEKHHQQVAWQSRSGPPHIPWLEPDICDQITELAKNGFKAVVISPIGFPIENFELVWDLDVEAAKAAEETGMNFVRAETVDSDPRFVNMVVDLVEERIKEKKTKKASLGKLAIAPDTCKTDCCPPPPKHG